MEHPEALPPVKKPRRKKSETAVLLAELQNENEKLKKQLVDVVATASANEKIWRHFAEIERILFRTRQLDQLVEELLGEIKNRFEPDQVILLLCHPDILERFFPEISMASESIRDGAWILPFPMETGSSLCGSSPKPFLLSSDNIGNLLRLLPESVSGARSGVLIPLCIHEILFGSLFLGSINEDRYHPKDGTDLLEQLGIKISLCMDNCLTYERVKDFAIQDPLTGLLNFFQIHTVIEREFRKARRTRAHFSVLVIDLSYFHEIDDLLDIGNGILRHVADLLRETLPKGDSFLGRYGSDEFLVLLPNVNEEEAREVVPYLNQMIRKAPFMHRNAAILIQTVIGVGTLGEHMKRPQELLDEAYMDLFRLKMGTAHRTG